MAVCKQCGKKGLFLRVDNRGFCQQCAQKRLNDLLVLANEHNSVFKFPVKVTEQAVMANVISSINSSKRIMADSAALIESTNNPDTFYTRLELLRKQIKYLVSFEMIDPSLFPGDSPAVISTQMDIVAKKSESAMWKRYFEATMEKVDKLKTDKSKRNAINKFFDLASQYDNQLSADAKATIANLKKRFDITL